jgi:uncharacterized protein (DUF427 family)
MALSPAYEKFPEHRIQIDDERVHIRVTLDGEILADTRRGLNLREGKYPAVVYIPREDVAMDRLRRSQLSTHCPFKGDASYFDGGKDAAGAKEVAWSYETPFDQMLVIQDHLAFYADRVEIERISE